MPTPNFELITELQTLTRRDFAVADPAILNPNSDKPLVDGEWLELDANYKLARGTNYGSLAVFPVHTERGRYDTQATQRANVLFLGQFEAETAIVDKTGLGVGDKLMIGDVTIGGITRRGLKKSDGKAGAVEVGYVTRLPSSGRVRFVRTSPVKLAALT